MSGMALPNQECKLRANTIRVKTLSSFGRPQGKRAVPVTIAASHANRRLTSQFSLVKNQLKRFSLFGGVHVF
jgi:hypothetical protein